MNFEIFWSKYPRKIAKRLAREVFNRMPKEDQEMAIKAIDIHLKHWKVEGTEMQFIPHATTWLRQGRFEDEIVVQAVKGKEWHETSTGLIEKGREFNLDPSQFAHFYLFKEAVHHAVNGKVINVKFG
jgi:hypothetical protein